MFMSERVGSDFSLALIQSRNTGSGHRCSNRRALQEQLLPSAAAFYT